MKTHALLGVTDCAVPQPTSADGLVCAAAARETFTFL